MVEIKPEITSARIGAGDGFYWVGWIAFGLGLLMSAGSRGDPGLQSAGLFLLFFGSGGIMAGFWTSIAHRLERRMIDLQVTILVASRDHQQSETQTSGIGATWTQ